MRGSHSVVEQMSVARERGVLPPGAPRQAVLALIDLAGAMHERATEAPHRRVMNPFDLPGPQFLALYAMLGVLVVVGGAITSNSRRKRASRGGCRCPIRMPSPTCAAAPSEAVSLGVAVLVDRQLLAIAAGDTLTAREGVTPMHGSNDLERAILEQCSTTAVHPRDLVSSGRLQLTARRLYEPTLPAHEAACRRRMCARAAGARPAVAIVVLVVVAVIKIAMGLSRNRPVSFLVMLAIAFSAVTVVADLGSADGARRPHSRRPAHALRRASRPRDGTAAVYVHERAGAADGGVRSRAPCR